MDYATDPTFKGNQKQPLMFFYFFWRGVTNDGHTFFLVEKRRLNCWKLLRSNSKRRKFDQKWPVESATVIFCNNFLEPDGHLFINGCFNWMIPNLYIGNGCFTKHPFKTGCLGYQVLIYDLGYPPPFPINSGKMSRFSSVIHYSPEGWHHHQKLWNVPTRIIITRIKVFSEVWIIFMIKLLFLPFSSKICRYAWLEFGWGDSSFSHPKSPEPGFEIPEENKAIFYT